MKTNAKEYLKEFATSQQDWLKALIYDSIESNGNITSERKNEIFKHLTDGTDLSITKPNISNETSESEIYITKFVHKSGVNALKNNQTIKFTNDDIEKKKNIDILEKEIKVLLENESINKQKENIKKWFDINSVENELRKKATKINTTKISNLSKAAHNDLLTETLKTHFSNELSSLGYENLGVKIENAKGKKGTSNTKLTLTKNKDIKAILSEGEQKAVALALFVAEAKIQKNINPIILDDPVNSLDHKIAGNFAECLLKLGNQVILFNHNKLFLDAFETSKKNHICKTIDSDCNKIKGKHIRIYQVRSEGVSSKGILSNYKSNRAKNHIREIKQLLIKSPFDDSIKGSNLMRKTVECTIDEIVFNNQVPTKHSNKNSRIGWAELKNLNNDSSIIENLEKIHGRVSGGEMHNGTENEENPIEIDEFNTMISDIENILNLSVQ